MGKTEKLVQLTHISRRLFCVNNSHDRIKLFSLSREEIETLSKFSDSWKRIACLELDVNQEFMNRFSAANFLPHTNAALFPFKSLEGIYSLKRLTEG